MRIPLAVLLLASAVRAAEPAAPAPAAPAPAPLVVRVIPAGGLDIKVGGIVQAWYQNQQHATNSFLIKNARVFFTADVSPYVSYNLMPAFMSAQGIMLLNAFIDVKPVNHLSFRVGQFVTPFGQNRMMPPGDMELANYHVTSRIYPGFASDLGWDVGAQAMLSYKYAEARVAAINGIGPNVTRDTDTVKDVTARVDFFPLGDKKAAAGFSYYYGTSHGNGTVAPLIADKRTWWGGHARWLLWDDRANLQAEIISRSDLQRLWTAQASWKWTMWKPWQAVGAWERFEPRTGLPFRRATAGLNMWLDPHTRATLNVFNDDAGVARGTNGLVAQLQVTF